MRRYKKKRGLIFEREVSEIYVRKIWSRSVIKIISWNCTDITGSFNFSHLGIFYIAGIVLLVYTYYRMFSKNISKMYAQNQKYLNAKYRAVVKRMHGRNSGSSVRFTGFIVARDVNRRFVSQREKVKSALPVQNAEWNS